MLKNKKLAQKLYWISSVAIVASLILFISASLAKKVIIELVHDDYKTTLTTVLATSHQAIRSWSEEEKKFNRIWANHPVIQKQSQLLLAQGQSPDKLVSHPAQTKIRQLLTPIIESKGYTGYFIINKNFISLSSPKNTNVGSINLLVNQKELLDSVWKGSTVLSLPQKSDLELSSKNNATFFTVSPIFNDKKEIVALFAFRLSPYHHFTEILQRGRLGNSGETYAFNKEGLLISVSRFDTQLSQTGLIEPHQASMLNIQVRSPGVNLTTLKKQPPDNTRTLPLTLMAQSAINGVSGHNLEGYSDYRGVSVIGAWLWDKELNFGITTEIDSDEAFRSLNRIIILINTLLTIGIISFAVCSIIFIASKIRLLKAKEELEDRVAQRTEEIYNISQRLNDAKKKAEQADKFKTLFMANISHEIRVPLMSITSLSELLLNTQLGEKQKRFMLNISGASQQLLQTAEYIMDLYRIETKQLRLKYKRFSIHDFIKEIDEQLLEDCTQNSIDYMSHVWQDVPDYAHGDVKRLGQIVMIVFSRASSCLQPEKMSLQVAKLEEQGSSVALEFTIKISGTQVSEEHQQTIINSLQKPQDNNMQNMDDADLGLWVASKLSLMMKGGISVDSDKSSITFSITSRLSLLPQKILNDDSEVHGKVLVLDPNEMARNTLHDLLESFGLSVVACDSIKSAVKTFSKHLEKAPFDLIISECKFNELSVLDFIGLLQSSFKNEEIPPLVLTSTSLDKQIRQNSEKLGVRHFLDKPVTPSPLFDCLIQILEKDKFLQHEEEKHIDWEVLANQLSGKRVLIAEDNPVNSSIILEILTKYKIVAVTAPNGAEAIKSLKRQQFDAVLMDIQMPVMDGLEATKRIRNELKLNELPVIALTANVLGWEKEKCYAAGLNDHITKPIQQGLLFTTLFKWLCVSDVTNHILDEVLTDDEM
ncbi:response regulator [Pleionea sp. CnH1-48]|uniref:response regulator n=1 Tax=Pleionea sp. CnH1-48 TaxID=2954494 RepID=UPI002096F0D3|nr:response regulator [Pleionea sp. CnH1-48]MCO7224542.1 response regulator [Pleionea sp. CnH1-48]